MFTYNIYQAPAPDDGISPGYSLAKRLFDIFTASILLILLSPVFLIIGILIRLESKGPIFYYSRRIGKDYQVFKFYKFRSMIQDADTKLKDMQHLNQYGGTEVSEVEAPVTSVEIPEDEEDWLVHDEGIVREADHIERSLTEERHSFVKFKDDPRITRIGKFIRNTSIDELPQLVNVLIGDMSLVGNRPLPLYEAEKLTADRTVERFMAPAGITGFWQVTDRGKSRITEDRRKELDVFYSRKVSFWLDLKILLKTPFAAFQSATY